MTETAKHLAQMMSEPRDFDFVPPKRSARCLEGKPKAALRFRRQKHVDRITVFVDSDCAGDPVSRKSTTVLVAQTGRHTVKSGFTFQILTALSVGEVEFYAVVKGCQVALSLRSLYMDLGIQMKVEIQSDSSSWNSLTDRFGAGPDRNTLKRRSQYQESSYRENCADVGTKPVCFCISTTQASQKILDWYSIDH